MVQLCIPMAEKSQRESQKEAAQQLFMNGMTQKEIASIVGKTEATIGKWVKDGKWDTLRSSQRGSQAAVLSNLYKRLEALTDNEKASADEIAKIASAIEKLSDDKLSLPIIINVFKDFTSYAFSKNAELAKQINTLQNEYVTEKLNSIG
jgi:hypothetical protein